jgi:hypothetical protein
MGLYLPVKQEAQTPIPQLCCVDTCDVGASAVDNVTEL